MPVIETYAKRKRSAERSGQSDVYQYDILPNRLLVQIERILDRALGSTYHNADLWRCIREPLCDELGCYTLANASDPKEDCLCYLRTCKEIDDRLSLIELAFRTIDRIVGGQLHPYQRDQRGITQEPNEAIKELNIRFREASVGYQYQDSMIIRVDSEFVHGEVVVPALRLLSDSRFAGAQEEFLAAHTHYRAGEHEDAIVDALRAFESTMKAICDANDWKYEKGARASDLVKIIRSNRLLPDYLDNSFDQLVATLQSGLPKVRNEAGGHGQGSTPRQTPSYVAAYALHLAAAKILLLVEAFQASNGNAS